MNKFKDAMHVLDVPETNKQEYGRAKAVAFSNMVK